MEDNVYQFDKPDNLVELFENSLAKYPDNPIFGTKDSKGEYQWVNYKYVGERVSNLRAGLAKLGVDKDDSIGFISSNSVEWAVGAFATYGRGARFVPMYEAELPSIWKYIINDATVKVLFVANEQVYEKTKSFLNDIPSLEHIFIIKGDGSNSMAQLEKVGSESPTPPFYPGPYDIAELIYTSGTTGDPKGVLLSHGNLTSNAQAGWHKYPDLGPNSRSLSILPWAHSFGQTAEVNMFLQFGGSVGFVESVNTIANDLQLVKPTHLVAVPRVFNKVYAGLWSKMEEQGGLAQKLFKMGVNAGKERRELAAQGKSSLATNLKFKMADKIVFKKIRERFGGRLECALTGSATMNIEIANFFLDLGIPIYDCYGLTETSPALSINCPAAFKFGSVGQVIEKSKVIIDTTYGDPNVGDGEVIAYGPNVMQGYHNKPEATTAVMTEDGGFRTGDLGRLDEDGFLYITGRIKEQYKLENGKYVFPASIEEEIKLLPNVANAMVYGDGKAYNVCLVVPDFEVLLRYAARHGLSTNPKQLVEQQEIKDLIAKEITEFLKGKYGGYEIPRKFVLLADDFTTENGMLTQTMKLKRRIVLKHYQDKINAQYN